MWLLGYGSDSLSGRLAIEPRRGAPVRGRLANQPRYAAAVSIPESLAELYAHSSQAQAVVDMMPTYEGPAPDHLWLGNAGDGAWVDIVGGISLGKVSTPVFAQADSRFGGAPTVRFDAGVDGFVDTVNDGTLNLGTGDYQILEAFGLNALATGYMFSKYASTGYRNYTLASGYMYHSVAGAGGLTTTYVNVNHGTVNAQVNLCSRGGGNNNLVTREGSHSLSAVAGNVTTSTAFKLGTGPAAAADSNLAVIALWKGRGDLTAANRLEFAQSLGTE